VKVRYFLRVARAHQPEESLRALMDLLAAAVSSAAKWLKSSGEKLSEKEYEQRYERGFGQYTEAKTGRKILHPWFYRRGSGHV
jgi:hypothetical protein